MELRRAIDGAAVSFWNQSHRSGRTRRLLSKCVYSEKRFETEKLWGTPKGGWFGEQRKGIL